MNTKVATLNLYGVPFSSLRARLDRICTIVEQKDIDIWNLQQVHTYDGVKMLQKRLPHYHLAYKRALIGPQAGLVTLAKKPLSESTFVPVNTASKTIGINTKGALVSMYNNELVVCNVHLSANTEGDWTNTSRFYTTHRKELQALKHIIKQHNCSLITGDFNIAGDSDIFQEFITEVGLKDIFADDFRPTFHKEFLPPGEPGRRIDHILVASPTPVQAKQTQHLFDELLGGKGVQLVYLSDHRGLYANIEMVVA